MSVTVPSGYKQTKVGVIPKDWELIKLEEISDFITKGATPTTYGFEWQESGIPFLRSECVSDNGLNLKAAMFISNDANIHMNRSEIKTGDLLMTITGNVGRVVLLKEPFISGNINQHIARVRVSSKNVDTKFIYYFISQNEYKINYYKITTGQAYPQISLKQVRDSIVPLPPLKEQQKIAQILSTWDDAISKQEQLIVAKERLKKGLMQRLLSGEVRFDGFDGEWEEVRLGNIGKIIRGVSYKPDDLSLSDNTETIRLMRSNNIQVGYLDIQKELQYVDKLKVKESQKLQLGDLAICMANGSKHLVGKNGDYTIVDDYTYTVGAFCAIFRFKENMVNRFFRYLFQTDKYNYYVQNLLAGSNINNLKGSDIEAMKFIIPNDNREQQKIAQVLTTADKENELLKKELEVLKEQKRGLMQRLLSGVVRTINIEERE